MAEDSRSNTPNLLTESAPAPAAALTIPEESPQSTPEPPAPSNKKAKGSKKSNKVAIEEVEETPVAKVDAAPVNLAAARDAVEEVKPSPKADGSKKGKKNKKEQGKWYRCEMFFV